MSIITLTSIKIPLHIPEVSNRHSVAVNLATNFSSYHLNVQIQQFYSANYQTLAPVGTGRPIKWNNTSQLGTINMRNMVR